VCATREWGARCEELGRVVTSARASGARLVALAATVSHHEGESLEEVAAAVADAWRAITADRRWKLWTSGVVRRVEVTHGANGWHPHVHAVIALAKGATIKDLRGLAVLWRETVRARAPAHLPTVSAGWHVQRVRDAAGGRYLGDAMGAELTDAGAKTPKASTSRTLYELARDAGAGDARAVALWQEFERWSHGRRALIYSRALSRVRQGLPPEEPGDAPLWTALVDAESWRTVRSTPWVMSAVCAGLRALWPRPPPPE